MEELWGEMCESCVWSCGPALWGSCVYSYVQLYIYIHSPQEVQCMHMYRVAWDVLVILCQLLFDRNWMGELRGGAVYITGGRNS